jgi:hypothetical protein
MRGPAPIAVLENRAKGLALRRGVTPKTVDRPVDPPHPLSPWSPLNLRMIFRSDLRQHLPRLCRVFAGPT